MCANFVSSPDDLDALPIGTILRIGQGPADLLVRVTKSRKVGDWLRPGREVPNSLDDIRRQWPTEYHVMIRYKPDEIDVSQAVAKLGPMPERIKARLIEAFRKAPKVRPRPATDKIREIAMSVNEMSAEDEQYGLPTFVVIALCDEIDHLREEVQRLKKNQQTR
ncbi:hypothetical protein [Nocardia sp. NPDC004860]|uniref:hypothetical protein n=1 Tax=Nocardia sp. NPDC004860 TaxID=3154557 RepID=UPI0033A8DCEB